MKRSWKRILRIREIRRRLERGGGRGEMRRSEEEGEEGGEER